MVRKRIAGSRRAVLVSALCAAAVAASAEVKVKEPPKPDHGVPAPQAIRGRAVMDRNGDGVAGPGEKGVAGVSVSDGYTVATTAADGSYAMNPSPLAVFIYVTRPAGHDVTGDWYKPVAPAVDFTLKRAAQSEEDYTFVHVTDTHISSAPAGLQVTRSPWIRADSAGI